MNDHIQSVDIWSGAGGPAGALSNLAAHAFVLDGQRCGSMEGFLQSLKYRDPEAAEHVRQLTGRRAKRAGRESGAQWRSSGTLHWRSQAFLRQSGAYQQLLDRAYAALFDQCEAAAVALRSTGHAKIVHSRGLDDPSQTVLTADEFCSRLTAIRQRLA